MMCPGPRPSFQPQAQPPEPLALEQQEKASACAGGGDRPAKALPSQSCRGHRHRTEQPHCSDRGGRRVSVTA